MTTARSRASFSDSLAPQDAMREHAVRATGAIFVATALHAIAVGQHAPRLPHPLRRHPDELMTICVDQTEFVVNKLKDRGTHQAYGVVTNAQDFMHVLRFYVEKWERLPASVRSNRAPARGGSLLADAVAGAVTGRGMDAASGSSGPSAATARSTAPPSSPASTGTGSGSTPRALRTPSRGRSADEFAAEVKEVGSGPLEALDDLVALVPKRTEEEPPVQIPLARWYPAEPDGTPDVG